MKGNKIIKNFINVRIETTNHDKTRSDIKHNLRMIKSRNKENSNQNININPAGEILTNQDIKMILKDYSKDRREHNKLFYEETNRNLRNRNSTWLSGVFTFSEKIHQDLGTKYSQEELIKIGLEAAHDLSKHLGTELKYLTLHMDEKTPHFHFHMKNYNQDIKKSIRYKFRDTPAGEKLQDLGFKYFSQLGMHRGISKKFTNINNKETQQYHEEKLQDIKDKIDTEISRLETLRKNVKDLELSTEEKRQLRKDYSSKIKEQKKELSQVKKDLSKRVNQIIENSKTGLLGGIDAKQLKQELYKDMKKHHNLIIQINDNKILDSENDKLRLENTELFNKYVEIKKQSPEVLNQTIKDLEKSLDTKTKQNTELYQINRQLEIEKNKIKNSKDILESELQEIKKKTEPDYNIYDKSKIQQSTCNNNDLKR